MTSVSEIEKISSSDQEIKIEPRRRDYIHLLLQSDKPFKKVASYWRLMSDPVIHRISDISYQTKNEENLMLAGIKEEEYYKRTPEELLDYCRNYALGTGFIDGSMELSTVKHHIFPTYYIDEAIRNEINELSPELLTVLHTTDIMYGLFYLLEGYES